MEELAATQSPDIIIREKKGPFSIGLVANAGTGYHWTQKLDKQDVVTFVGEQTLPIKPASPPGAPVEFRFDYEAKKPGEALVTFNLIGPDKKVTKTDTVDFIVTG